MSTTTAFYRTLGRSELQVSALGLGCWAIGGQMQFLEIQAGWGDVDDQESIRAIHRALDLGVNFFDTAANYGTGHSEQLLGRALANHRDKAIIATKFGFNADEATKTVSYYADEVVSHVRGECEDSLRRLNTDVIDLYQLHLWDYPHDQIEPMLDVLESLVSEGKIRYYGWSTDNFEGARLFAQGKHCIAIQHDLNVVKDAPEMLALCDEFNLASVNRSPLARGALTGKYTKDSVFPSNDVRNDNWSRETFLLPTVERLDAIREVLTSGGRTLAQGALAWIWARSEKTIPIPGFKTVAQVDDNAGAMQYGPLTADQMGEIDSLLGR
jgi:aryl-alcohol dehydrogenase-like predicted oxidoreductase